MKMTGKMAMIADRGRRLKLAEIPRRGGVA